jgi:hypothetical protein
LAHLTLGHALAVRRSSSFVALVVAAPSCRQHLRSPARHRLTLGPGASRSFAMQASDAQRRPSPARRHVHDHGATRSHHIGMPARAGQFVVRASRGSAAPGSQRVVSYGECGNRGSGAACGARTSQRRLAASQNALMVIRFTKAKASREHERGLTQCSTGHLAAAHAWPSISFWAKRGLPQGAG